MYLCSVHRPISLNKLIINKLVKLFALQQLQYTHKVTEMSSYSDNQKTPKWEDDYLAIFQCICCRFKANSFTRHF